MASKTTRQRTESHMHFLFGDVKSALRDDVQAIVDSTLDSGRPFSRTSRGRSLHRQICRASRLKEEALEKNLPPTHYLPHFPAQANVLARMVLGYTLFPSDIVSLYRGTERYYELDPVMSSPYHESSQGAKPEASSANASDSPQREEPQAASQEMAKEASPVQPRAGERMRAVLQASTLRRSVTASPATAHASTPAEQAVIPADVAASEHVTIPRSALVELQSIMELNIQAQTQNMELESRLVGLVHGSSVDRVGGDVLLQYIEHAHAMTQNCLRVHLLLSHLHRVSREVY